METNQEEIVPQIQNTKSISLLVFFILLTGLLAAVYFVFFPSAFTGLNNTSEIVHWMVPLGIAIMVTCGVRFVENR
jgi:hypothetical protein